MSAKHRKASKLAAKRTAVAATAVGATAAIGMMGAPAQAAAATETPNYTQIISDYSHAYDNFLLGAGNLGGAAGAAWNPIASQVPLGLLPTFSASASQADLTSITGILTALGQIGQVQIPDNIPGLPNGNAIPGIGTIPGVGDAITPVLGGVNTVLDVVGPVLAGLEAANNDPLIGGLLTGIPSLSSLIDGLEITSTVFDSSYSWLGMGGSTSASNLFLSVPQLTAQKLITDIVSNLKIAGQPIPANGLVADLLGGVLAPLSGLVSTPSITAWLPSAGGLYDLPLGGSTGWFATMPTLALGPVSVLGVPASTTDTVVAIPVGGFGLNAPLNLFQTGFINTPGLVLPTATGVTTVGGTTIGQFNIPLLPTPALYLNTLQSNYFGTNGFHTNSGQTVLTLPGIPVPIVYSMGAYNFGTTGAGFTLPSLFGVGLLPAFQVGTAPGQTSPDGLIPASVLNAIGPRLLPTQLTSVTQLLGLPDFMSPAGTALTPLYTGLVTPLLMPLSDFATQQYGPFLNGSASGLLSASQTFKDLSGKASDAIESLPAAPTPTPLSGPSTTALKTSTPVEEAVKPVTPMALRNTPPPIPNVAQTETDTGPETTIPAPKDTIDTSNTPPPKETSGGKHREGTPVRDIVERVGDKVQDGIGKVSDKITESSKGRDRDVVGGADKATADKDTADTGSRVSTGKDE